jgi:hypothetical protein
MSKPTGSTVAGPLVIADTFGRVQIAPADGSVTVDIQGRHYDTDAQLRIDHGVARLSIPQAIRLRHLLDTAIDVALDAPPHQSGLWSQATTRFAAGRFV